jgi:diguanylate cyclase (GGDEF)-like protein/PAS domain S-box-containing protein
MARKNPLAASSHEEQSAFSRLAPLLESGGRLQEEMQDLLIERQSWESERTWLRAMIDQVPDYVFAKDRQCRFIIANRAVAADLGHGDPAALLGKTDLELHSPELAVEFMRIDQSVIDTGHAVLNHEEYVVRPNGEMRWLSTSKSPLLDVAGNVIGLVGIARDVTEQRKAEEDVRFLAFHDPLTRLPNRRLFEKTLRRVLAGKVGESDGSALLYLDLDRFKQINDSLGHQAGDELIREVAVRLSKLPPAGSFVARLGGDEFAILLSNLRTESEALVRAQEISALLKSGFDIGGNPVEIGGSIGIAWLASGAAPDDAIRQADIALYQAKSRGGDKSLVFRDWMAAKLDEGLRIEHDLATALRKGDQLLLLYQPVYAANGRTLVGAEALVRWQHPELGLLAPDVFIGVAEERGLIGELGRWVLEEACAELGRTACPWIAVNVSPAQMQNPRFAEAILETLVNADVSPMRLQIEVTEGVLIKDAEQTAATLARLREAGVKVALDDFGTSYSSLNYLQRYNVDKLKVHRSFVEKLGSSKGADAIVRALVSLGRAMQMKVTAEGVETQAQRDHLVAIGCHELQGFLFARPLPASELRRLVIEPPG